MPINVGYRRFMSQIEMMQKEARTVHSEGAMFEHSETQRHVCFCVCMRNIREAMYQLKVVR
jgi:hypothetical protein